MPSEVLDVPGTGNKDEFAVQKYKAIQVWSRIGRLDLVGKAVRNAHRECVEDTKRNKEREIHVQITRSRGNNAQFKLRPGSQGHRDGAAASCGYLANFKVEARTRTDRSCNETRRPTSLSLLLGVEGVELKRIKYVHYISAKFQRFKFRLFNVKGPGEAAPGLVSAIPLYVVVNNLFRCRESVVSGMPCHDASPGPRSCNENFLFGFSFIITFGLWPNGLCCCGSPHPQADLLVPPKNGATP